MNTSLFYTRFFSVVLIVLLTSNLSFADADISSKLVDVWCRMAVPENKKFLFCAIEEDPFFHVKYGQWQPSHLIKVSGKFVDVKMNLLERTGSKISYSYSIRNDAAEIFIQTSGRLTDLYDIEEKRNIACSFYQEKDANSYCFEIPIITEDANMTSKLNGNRRIWFIYVDDSSDLVNIVKVSRACAGFNWATFIRGVKNDKP